MAPAARRVRIDLAYDGTRFGGWQVQPGRPTVQGVVEEALSRLCGGEVVRIRGAGRTDAGVHARGQVADAWLAIRLDDSALERSLSGLLPADVRPVGVRTVDDAFHARKSAVSKTYRYQLDRRRFGDPFLARFALHHPYPIDRQAIDDALRRLHGTRDWGGFAAAACIVDNRRRTMSAARFEQAGAIASFTFTADGFLTHMVRNLVGTLLEIGRGAMPAGVVDRILEGGDRRLAGPTAKPHGLCLEAVRYPDEPEENETDPSPLRGVL